MDVIYSFLNSTLDTASHYGSELLDYTGLKGRITNLSKSLNYYIENISLIFKRSKERDINPDDIIKERDSIEHDFIEIQLRSCFQFDNPPNEEPLSSDEESDVSMAEPLSAGNNFVDESSSDEEDDMDMEAFLAPWERNDDPIEMISDENAEHAKITLPQKRDMQIQEIFDRNFGMFQQTMQNYF